MSGFSAQARSTATRPFGASPTTSMSARSASSARRPWRTVSWSSAMSTRIFFMTRPPDPPPGSRPAPPGRPPCPAPAAIRSAAYAPISDARSCMPMMPMPLSRARSRSAGSKPTPLSSTTQPHESVAGFDQDVDAAGVRVLEHVVERFLRDAVEDRLRVAAPATPRPACRRGTRPGCCSAATTRARRSAARSRGRDRPVPPGAAPRRESPGRCRSSRRSPGRARPVRGRPLPTPAARCDAAG